MVEALKLAEDGSGDVIVRLYEALGTRTAATVAAGFEYASAVATDLLERELVEEVPPRTEAGGVVLQLRPFQLVTLRFRR